MTRVSRTPVCGWAPSWVSWRVTRWDLGESPRKPVFDADPELPPGFYRVTHRDYSGGGFEEWGPSSYALGGSSTATATAESENGEEAEPAHQPEEPADSVHALPPDQSEEAAAERAANGTARVPEH